MISSDKKNYAKSQALYFAGRIVWFQEVEGGTKKLGRVVGYYYDMAQVLLEVAGSAPVQYEVDPSGYIFTVVVRALDLHRPFCSVDVFLLDTKSPKQSPRYPHACPRCLEPALIIFRTVECSNFSCRNYVR